MSKELIESVLECMNRIIDCKISNALSSDSGATGWHEDSSEHEAEFKNALMKLTRKETANEESMA